MTMPVIIGDTENWSVVYKPHNMPSAPLIANENGTLLSWFLSAYPQAAQVIGKKKIECGLMHRLDTGTAGLVLIAKNQETYDVLSNSQTEGLIHKTYDAVCISAPSGKTPVEIAKCPFTIKSRFRTYGPGGKEVRPLFEGMRGYDNAKTDYETTIEKIEPTADNGIILITCSLTRGFRHQVRAHLAYIGYPILCDSIYNSKSTAGDLRLRACALTFPDPASGLPVSFSLPPQDKMNL